MLYPAELPGRIPYSSDIYFPRKLEHDRNRYRFFLFLAMRLSQGIAGDCGKAHSQECYPGSQDGT